MLRIETRSKRNIGGLELYMLLLLWALSTFEPSFAEDSWENLGD